MTSWLQLQTILIQESAKYDLAAKWTAQCDVFSCGLGPVPATPPSWEQPLFSSLSPAVQWFEKDRFARFVAVIDDLQFLFHLIPSYGLLEVTFYMDTGQNESPGGFGSVGQVGGTLRELAHEAWCIQNPGQAHPKLTLPKYDSAQTCEALCQTMLRICNELSERFAAAVRMHNER